MDGLVVLEFLY
jgi:hypothetical protein